MSRRGSLCLATVLAASFAFPLAAQEARGTLLGRVTDSSDAVVIGAKVDALNADTGVRLSTTTNRTGRKRALAS